MGQFYDEEKIKAMEAAAGAKPATPATPAPAAGTEKPGGRFYDEAKIRSMEAAAGAGGGNRSAGLLKVLVVIVAIIAGIGLLWWKAKHNPATMIVDLNKASAAELSYLPGIGDAKARVIMEHRPFKTIEDLKKVPGIGEKTFEKMKPRVKVE